MEVISGLLHTRCGYVILPKRVAQQQKLPFENSFGRISSHKDSLCLVYRPLFRKTALGRALIDAFT